MQNFSLSGAFVYKVSPYINSVMKFAIQLSGLCFCIEDLSVVRDLYSLMKFLRRHSVNFPVFYPFYHYINTVNITQKYEVKY